jgi:hypothetical protein
MMGSEREIDMGDGFRDLAQAFHGTIDWKWDGRFKVALGEFPVGSKEQVRAILDRSFVHVWDSSNIKAAPDVVQQVKALLGGLMPGQLLFVSNDAATPYMFCAWWPWGNGTTISIRMAPFGARLPAADAAAEMAVFRAALGIEP